MKKLPTNWSDISIETYQEILRIKKKHSKEFETTLIAHFLGKTVNEVKKFSISEIRDFRKSLSFIDKEITNEVEETFKIDDSEYGLIPSFEDMTVDEILDLKTLSSNLEDNLHAIAAILFRPTVIALNPGYRFIEEYNSASIASRSSLFQQKLSVTKVYGAILFFSIICEEFANLFLKSLEEEKILTMKKIQENQEKIEKLEKKMNV